MTKEQQRSDPDAARDAEFLGWQKVPRGNVVALYNVTAEGHISYGSTVSEKTLQELNLRVPKTPPDGIAGRKS
jgi:hypothetical protein